MALNFAFGKFILLNTMYKSYSYKRPSKYHIIIFGEWGLRPFLLCLFRGSKLCKTCLCNSWTILIISIGHFQIAIDIFIKTRIELHLCEIKILTLFPTWRVQNPITNYQSFIPFKCNFSLPINMITKQDNNLGLSWAKLKLSLMM